MEKEGGKGGRGGRSEEGSEGKVRGTGEGRGRGGLH